MVALHHPARIARPVVRRGWPERGPGADPRRGHDDFQGCTGQLTAIEVEHFEGDLPPIRTFEPPHAAAVAEQDGPHG